MNLYEKNLEFFKENLKSIYNTLIFEESKYDSKVTVVDPLNLKVENEGKICFVHSNYNAERENNEMFSNVNENTEKIVIFGIGLCNCKDYIGSKFKKMKNITIIEPDLNVFKIMLNYFDIMELMNKAKNVTFIINKNKEEVTDILWQMFKKNVIEKMELIYNISYRSLYADYYEYINQEFTKNIKNFLINMSTTDLFLYKWTENAIKNYNEKAIPITKFFGKFTGVPIIIVAAGPSLNYNMHYLKQVKDKAIIIAVGSAIKILDSNGIVPHFRMAFDAGENERNIFNEIDTETSALIFSDLLNYHIVDEYKGNKFRMVLDTDYISQYINQKLYNEEFTFESGFSVANVAVDVAIKLGFKKIIFIGQDLCYTEGSLYAKGSWKKQDGNIDFQNSRYTRTINSLGDTVYTDKPFLGMKDLLEKKIKANSKITFINATERGLNIDGTLNKSFIKVMEEDLNVSYGTQRLINETIDQNEEYNSNRDQKLEQLNLTIQIKDLIKINDIRFSRLKKLRKYYKNGLGIHKLQLEFNYIKNMENELENIEFYKNAVKPSLFNKLNAIYMKYYYNGKDEKILLENNIKALLGRTVELKQYLEFLIGLIEEKGSIEIVDSTLQK